MNYGQITAKNRLCKFNGIFEVLPVVIPVLISTIFSVCVQDIERDVSTMLNRIGQGHHEL